MAADNKLTLYCIKRSFLRRQNEQSLEKIDKILVFCNVCPSVSEKLFRTKLHKESCPPPLIFNGLNLYNNFVADPPVTISAKSFSDFEHWL